MNVCVWYVYLQKMRWLFGLLLAVVYNCLPPVNAHPTFVTMIPNGQRVPSPCDPSKVWQGVGHTNMGGGGPRNPFGMDFKLHNFVRCRTLT